MDRDGHQGWSRRAEAGWLRVFAPTTQRPHVLRHLERLCATGYLDPGEVIESRESGRRYVVTSTRELQELPNAVPAPESETAGA